MTPETELTQNVSRETGETPSCSRCEKPLDTTGYPKWCKACRAKNQREYQRTLKDMGESRGYAAGLSAMRSFIGDELAARGTMRLPCHELARWVRNCKGPEPVEG